MILIIQHRNAKKKSKKCIFAFLRTKTYQFFLFITIKAKNPFAIWSHLNKIAKFAITGTLFYKRCILLLKKSSPKGKIKYRQFPGISYFFIYIKGKGKK
jgi:hypothetical protein